LSRKRFDTAAAVSDANKARIAQLEADLARLESGTRLLEANTVEANTLKILHGLQGDVRVLFVLAFWFWLIKPMIEPVSQRALRSPRDGCRCRAGAAGVALGH
jgi:hypothetical protein